MLNYHESEPDAMRRRRHVAKAAVIARSDKTVPSPSEYTENKIVPQGTYEVLKKD